MADIVGSLFGISTDQIQQQRAAEQDKKALLFAQMNDEQTQRYLGYHVGDMLGKGVSKLLGVQDPELKRASDLEGALAETQSEVASGDPLETYSVLAKKLADKGLGQEALQVRQQAFQLKQQRDLENAKIQSEQMQGLKWKAEALKALREDDPNQKIFLELAKNASPKSVAAAIQNGYDVGLLDSPEKTKLSSFGQQLVDAGYPIGSVEFQKKMQEYISAEMTGKSKGSGNVSVNLGGISVDSKKLGEAAGKVVGEAAADIEEQYSQLDDFANAKKMLDQGIFSGEYGAIQMDIAKKTRQNLKKVANTEKFKSYIASNVIKRLKDIGGNDTKEERDYLEAMIGGEIKQEPEAIKAVIERGEEKVRKIIARRKAQVKSAATGGDIPLEPVKGIRRYNKSTGKLEEVK